MTIAPPMIISGASPRNPLISDPLAKVSERSKTSNNSKIIGMRCDAEAIVSVFECRHH
jgi:hypothetical protein